MGTVDMRVYGGQQKGAICDTRRPYPSIWRTPKPVFRQFNWLVVITSCVDAYISRYGNLCANDNINNTIDYFIPLRMCTG